MRRALPLSLLVACACGARTNLDLDGLGAPGEGGGGGTSGAVSPTVGPAGPGATGVTSASGTGGAGGEGTPHVCAPGEPALDLAAIVWPIAAAHDAANLYVASYTEEGGVFRVPKDGGEPVLLARLSYASGVAVAGDFVYVAASGDREVVRVPKAGGAAERLAGFFGPSDVVVDGDALFVANYLDEEVARLPLGGGDPVVIASGESGVYRLAAAEGLVAWGSFQDELRAAPQQGGAVTVLAPFEARRIAARSPFFYFTSNTAAEPGRVLRATSTGAVQVVVEDREAAFVEGLDVDATHVYYARWVGSGVGSLARAPLEGGPIDDLLAIAEPMEVVVDGSCLYITSGTSEELPGRVVRLPVPAD